MENIIRLPVHYDFSMVGAANGYIFFVGFPKDHTVDATHFSLQIRTSKIEMVCRTIIHSCYIHPYFEYPPSVSPKWI
uniref:Uncharacterized protein n=1 Tax=Arundo donax TaxID=35708 RepID=A0A0A9H0I6_ARUDO